MLRDFILQGGEPRRLWAERLGITTSYLSLLESGTKTPSLDLAVRIERLTGGAVPASSWIPDPGKPIGERAEPEGVDSPGPKRGAA